MKAACPEFLNREDTQMMPRRPATRLLIAMVLGVVTTIAVAWWCGATSMLELPTDRRTAVPSGDSGRIVVHELTGFGIARCSFFRIDWPSVFVESWTMYDAFPAWGPMAGADAAAAIPDLLNAGEDLIGQGWPFIALWCAQRTMSTDVRGGWRVATTHTPGTFLSTDHVVAFRPSWPGFLANTAIYGVAWWMALFLTGVVRRRVRARRGRCLACNYDLRATIDPRCPECGAAMARYR
jgi:hypothetical protein